MKRISAVLGLIMMLASAGWAADGKSPFFPVEEIKPGMKAVGRTIFEGGKTQEFEVEILGVLEGTPAPGRSLIVIRLIGPLAERSGVFQGMSGSPVFIDGRLVGAIAYAFPFSKEPIGMITPIQDTLDVFKTGDGANTSEKPNSAGISFKEYAAATYSHDFDQKTLQAFSGFRPVQIGPQAAAIPGLASYVGQSLLPIATPLGFSGVDPQVMQFFAGHFQALGLQPVAGFSGGSTTTPESAEPVPSFTADTLTPGKTIAVELVRGDLKLAGAGTVTWRDGNKIYAFGHPLFSLGVTNLPMIEANVITVVPSMMASFKLSTTGKIVGSINQDRATGIFGELGARPKMIPLKITMVTSRGNKVTYNMEIANDQTLAPLLVQISTLNSIIATERGLGDLTLSLDGRIRVKGQQPIAFSNRFSGANNSFISAVFYASSPLLALYGSGFNFDVEGIELELTAADRRATGTLTRLSVDRTEVKRGETVMMQAFARNERGETYLEKIPVTIPADAPYGRLNITLGDGNVMAALDRRALVDSNPKDLGALVKAMNRLPKNDRLYVKLYHSDAGAVINNEEMPSLPPSMLAALDSARTTGGYMPLPIATVLNQELPPAQFLINGQQTITIKIVP
jgi:hypothetical protein